MLLIRPVYCHTIKLVAMCCNAGRSLRRRCSFSRRL